ncbi:hypothetical protein QBC32DRAFT_362794 [Pseudoneurospora amorphoporcata]|uniref:Uncharacterized protein n=1 Tax=Pseudoneurospora amorphoporcata TaxID=241081 RepID=A0AAN6NUG9_9PEZI|nr:hypothetical protein QBC32DRAFT_362794 [Pseudoneurospora amorphoporcata]
MSSPLPVPSKAALTALRGLVVGTSCTLALIAEDRRRRIRNALTAIENGERIRQARNYNTGGAALAVALEEESLLDAGILPLAPEPSAALPAEIVRQYDNARIAESERLRRGEDVSESKTTRGEHDSRPHPCGQSRRDTPRSFTPRKRTLTGQHHFIPLVEGVPITQTRPYHKFSRRADNEGGRSSLAFPSNDSIVVMIQEACRTKELGQMEKAALLIFEATTQNQAPNNLDDAWMEASALLCRTYLDLERAEDAAKILSTVLARAPLTEARYFDFQPVRLIESLLAKATQAKTRENICSAKLETAISLFLPRFIEKPVVQSAELLAVGRALLDHAFAVGKSTRAIDVYWRCISVSESQYDFTSWVITKLHDTGDYKAAIRLFLANYCKMSPSAPSIIRIAGPVVQCVEKAHNYKPAQVLKTLLNIASAECQLKTEWIMRLLTAHWRRHGSFEELEALFQQLIEVGLKDVVYHLDGVYRVMIELALEAGEDFKAESIFAQASAELPQLAHDVRLLGIFARFKAKQQDWEGVRESFAAMKLDSKPALDACGTAFVPVVKTYAKDHTVQETDAFVRSYITDLKVPLSRFLVTLMAKQYASIRNLESFVEWLEYCSIAGFQVDAAFTNAVLVSCRRNWNVPFRDLRTLFRKLRALNPNFVDRHTERVMMDAALSSNNKLEGGFARGRVLSLRITPNMGPVKGKCDTEHEVTLAMKEALSYRHPAKALSIYKRALHLGMPFSECALRLAVNAQLKLENKPYRKTYDLVLKAQDQGNNVDPILNYLLGLQLADLAAKGGEIRSIVQTAIDRIKEVGLKIADTFLHRAALICLTSGHFEGAHHYALMAAESNNHSEPCYNLDNFRIMLYSFAGLLNIDGIRQVLAKALSSNYKEHTGCLKALKRAREMVMEARLNDAKTQQRHDAYDVLSEGIDKMVESRQRLQSQRAKLGMESVRIMRQAALDAGVAPVDFAEIPWLNSSKPRIRQDDDGAELDFEEEFRRQQEGQEEGGKAAVFDELLVLDNTPLDTV